MLNQSIAIIPESEEFDQGLSEHPSAREVYVVSAICDLQRFERVRISQNPPSMLDVRHGHVVSAIS
jgi:hypothetical protein